MIVSRTPLTEAAPFDIAEVARHCRAEEEDFEDELERLAYSAVAQFEDLAQVALLHQTVAVTLESADLIGALAGNILFLPVSPLIDATTLTVTEDGGAFTSFTVLTGQRPAIRFHTVTPQGLVVITYRAGFGDSHSDIPLDVRNAIHDQTAALFDSRGDFKTAGHGLSPHMARIAARYRRVSL